MRDGAPGEGISTVFLQQPLMQKNSVYTKLTLRAKITALAIIWPDNIKSRHINLLAELFLLFKFFVISLCIFLALGEGFTMRMRNTKTILQSMPKGTKCQHLHFRNNFCRDLSSSTVNILHWAFYLYRIGETISRKHFFKEVQSDLAHSNKWAVL